MPAWIPLETSILPVLSFPAEDMRMSFPKEYAFGPWAVVINRDENFDEPRTRKKDVRGTGITVEDWTDGPPQNLNRLLDTLSFHISYVPGRPGVKWPVASGIIARRRGPGTPGRPPSGVHHEASGIIARRRGPGAWDVDLETRIGRIPLPLRRWMETLKVEVFEMLDPQSPLYVRQIDDPPAEEPFLIDP